MSQGKLDGGERSTYSQLMIELNLSAFEARVLGVLAEKAFLTPDVYPLSLNGVVNSCNQLSNR